MLINKVSAIYEKSLEFLQPPNIIRFSLLIFPKKKFTEITFFSDNQLEIFITIY